MYSSQGFGFDILRNQGSYPWSIPNEKDKNKSIMLQSSSATSTTKKKQPTQSKSQSQPKKTASKELWETTESVTRPQTSSYDEVKKRSQDRMQRFGIGVLRQGKATSVFGNNSTATTPQKKVYTAESFGNAYGIRPKQTKQQSPDYTASYYTALRQAEEDARYENYDIDAAEMRLYDDGYWTERIFNSREEGNGFEGDKAVKAEYDALKSEIEKATAAQARNRARRYASIPTREDFERYSNIGDGRIYFSEFDNPDSVRYMTPDEGKVYTYLYYKDGIEKANEYLKYLEPQLIGRIGNEQGENVKELGIIGQIPYRAIAGLEGYSRNIQQVFSEEPIPLTPMAHANRYLSENTEGIGKFAGDLAYGIGNTAPSVAAGMLNPMLGKASLAANSYGGTYNGALLEGNPKGAARTYAALKTTGDVAMQHLLGGIPQLSGNPSLNSVVKNLSGKINNAAFRVATQLGGSSISEGMENALQTYVEAGLQNLILDEDFNLRDVSEEAIYNSLLGAASAAVFNAPNAAWEYKHYYDLSAEPFSRYVNSSDKLYKFSAQIKPIEGYEDVIIHGDPFKFFLRDSDDNEFGYYVPRELAEILKEDPNYHGGPIRLISCETGFEDFGAAQMLAELLNVEVLAPTRKVWVLPNGEMRVGNDVTSNDGEWRIFRPMGVKK